MRRFTLATVALTALLGGGALLTGVPAASAMIASGLSASGIAESVRTASPLEEVRHRYYRHRHGTRYRHRRGVHRHYYGGYWYSTPWWTVPHGYYYSPPVLRAPTITGRCAYWHNQCVRNWGSRNSNYYGCMRFHGCL